MTLTAPPRTHRCAALAAPLVALALGGCSSAQPLDRAAAPSNDNRLPRSPTVQVAPALPMPSSIADLVERVAPSVVNITTLHVLTGHEGRGPFDFMFPEGHRMPRARTGAGTGFVVDAAGFVITNAHVVHGADEVTVRLRDDRQFDAKVVGRDGQLDLALLRLENAPQGLAGVVLGNSAKLRVGESVVAVGNPYGLGHTVTMGIVSAKERSIGAGPYDAFIQTDASINPGNSGGPLFNLRGEVVGINTAIRAGADGIGFAIPVDSLKDVVDQLKSKGYVERGKLGLAFQPVTAEVASALGLDRPHGALVRQVLPDTAAARAGILRGDLITAVDDQPVRHSEDLPRLVARHAPGSTITVHLARRGKALSVKATLDKLEREPTPPQPPAAGDPTSSGKRLGIEVKETPAQDGVMVMGMSRPIRGLRRGDVIVEADFKPVTTVVSLKQVVDARKPGEAILLGVRRGNEHMFIGVRLAR